MYNNIGFSEVYKRRRWTADGNGSGPGSTLKNTKSVRKFIDIIINKHKITSIVDVSCGGMCWWPSLLENHPDIQFYGLDVAGGLIRELKQKYKHKKNWQFEVFDISKPEANIPECDLLICRHTLNHLSCTDVKLSLANLFNSSSKYLCISNFPDAINPREDEGIPLLADIPSGFKFRFLNLESEPFLCPPPIKSCKDDDPLGCELGLWKINHE